MTNINCSSNCIFQKDGKCHLQNTNNQSINNSSTQCSYFKEK
ncbi:MAG: hydroxymyristoyl-ACP dehydratase [Clostridiales bacterium]|nr:hydroxymyristoyl-ACP dehydratase [Clostridiales bacterium]